MVSITVKVRSVKVSTTKTTKRGDDATTVKRVRVERESTRTRTTGGKLSFSKGNAKLEDVYTMSLPAGWTCPFASACLSKADRTTGKLEDGPKTEFRCFSASAENHRPNVRHSRWGNLEMLRGLNKDGMVALLLASLPKKARTVRPHVSGDFFSLAYFDAWMEVARQRPDVLFYAYTKSLSYWVARLGTIPANFVLTASRGGKDDALIAKHGLRSAVVVYSEQEAADLGLEIDHDDSHAMRADGKDFALLIHGVQPAGSKAAKAIASLRAIGEYGYGETADLKRIEAGRVPLAMAPTEAEVMARHRLRKPSVLPPDLRNVLLERNYPALQKGIGGTRYARSLGGDEASSVIGEVASITARTFDPAKYTDPATGRPFGPADVRSLDAGRPRTELDRVFENYLHAPINSALRRHLEKRTRETPSGAAGTDYGSDLPARGVYDPAELDAAREQLAMHGSVEAALAAHGRELVS